MYRHPHCILGALKGLGTIYVESETSLNEISASVWFAKS